MRYLWVLLLVGCTQEYTFEAFTNSKHVNEVVIKNAGNVIEIGELPVMITAEEDDFLVAEFDVEASKFGHNHPQCNCVETSNDYWECAETFKVTGKDWEIAK